MKKLALAAWLFFSGATYGGAQTNTTISELADGSIVHLFASGGDTTLVQTVGNNRAIYTNLNTPPYNKTTVDFITSITGKDSVIFLRREYATDAVGKKVFNDLDKMYRTAVQQYIKQGANPTVSPEEDPFGIGKQLDEIIEKEEKSGKK